MTENINLGHKWHNSHLRLDDVVQSNQIVSCFFPQWAGLLETPCPWWLRMFPNQTYYQFSPDHVCDTGSGQQSVTGVSSVEDSNSYWSVRGTSGALCHRGTPVKCGQTIRLTHVNTGRNLHSHYFASPLSSNQVSGVRGECLYTKSPPKEWMSKSQPWQFWTI